MRGVVYIPGFTSGKDDDETIILKKYFEDHCRSNFLCYDPRGIGQSDLMFSDCNLSTWIEDACKMINLMLDMTNQPPMVIGKSLGGHVASCIALRKMCEIQSLVLLCPAINYGSTFHEYVKTILTRQQLKLLESGEVILVDLGSHENWEPFQYSLKLYEDNIANSIMKSNHQIEGNFPVRIIHGMKDQTLPFTWSLSLEFDKMFQSDDLQLTLVKDCDHMLISDKNGFDVVKNTIEHLIKIDDHRT